VNWSAILAVFWLNVKITFPSRVILVRELIFHLTIDKNNSRNFADAEKD